MASVCQGEGTFRTTNSREAKAGFRQHASACSVPTLALTRVRGGLFYFAPRYFFSFTPPAFALKPALLPGTEGERPKNALSN